MHAIHDEPIAIPAPVAIRRESAALKLLKSGDLGAHLLHLARGAAAEHLAHLAQEQPEEPASATLRGAAGVGGSRP
jgi:hypothetical protein